MASNAAMLAALVPILKFGGALLCLMIIAVLGLRWL